MEPELRFSPKAVNQINEYLASIYDDVLALAASLELRRELLRLAADPRLGTAPTGPFELRPIYRFRLEAGDRRRLAQVSYRVAGPGKIDILLFVSTPV